MKYSTSTYLRGIDNYKLYLYKNNNEILIKHENRILI